MGFQKGGGRSGRYISFVAGEKRFFPYALLPGAHCSASAVETRPGKRKAAGPEPGGVAWGWEALGGVEPGAVHIESPDLYKARSGLSRSASLDGDAALP